MGLVKRIELVTQDRSGRGRRDGQGSGGGLLKEPQPRTFDRANEAIDTSRRLYCYRRQCFCSCSSILGKSVEQWKWRVRRGQWSAFLGLRVIRRSLDFECGPLSCAKCLTGASTRKSKVGTGRPASLTRAIHV
ncbi:hypothetical protein CEXT_178981 [Caerostris extrusa]|uniref:Uncharacterized protein n=1 Tax=Caerostris extrusa TaxID=172846 RepID=A0AAV4RT74_CAEEX|nr:hypothetical protein CEXT_178981 [Caerostris extrusa]